MPTKQPVALLQSLQERVEARIGQEGIEVYGFRVRRGGKRPSLNSAGPGRALQGEQWDCFCKSTLAPSHPMLDSGGMGVRGVGRTVQTSSEEGWCCLPREIRPFLERRGGFSLLELQ